MMNLRQQRANLKREARTFTVSPFELRDTGTGTTFVGDASMVDTPYVVTDAFGEFTETMVKGAFDKTLRDRADVRLLVNHTGVPLARTKSGTLTLSTTPHLHAEAHLDEANPTVQEVRSAMKRGDLDQMSIGFRAIKDEWNDDYTQRRVLEAALFDVSVVTDPASPTTTASLRTHFVANYTFGETSPNPNGVGAPETVGVTPVGNSTMIGEISNPNVGPSPKPVGPTTGPITGPITTTIDNGLGTFPDGNGTVADSPTPDIAEMVATLAKLANDGAVGPGVNALVSSILAHYQAGNAGAPLDPNRFARKLIQIRAASAMPVNGIDPGPLLLQLDMALDTAEDYIDQLLDIYGLVDVDSENDVAATGPGAMPPSQMLAKKYTDLQYQLMARKQRV